MRHGLEVLARLTPWSRSVELMVIRRHGDGGGATLEVAEVNCFWHTFVAGQHLPEQPTLRLDQDEAQRLMDQLWDCGLRPSEGSGSAGALAATQAHLADMRDQAKRWHDIADAILHPPPMCVGGDGFPRVHTEG